VHKNDNVRTILQILAFFFPHPVNVWLHRLASAKIGRHALIHPGVLILARSVEIGPSARIRFGTMISARSFSAGEKTLIGYFVQAKGMSDLKIGPACVIGPQTMINCDCPVTLNYYSGVGPRCTLFTHGSFLPTTEGYRTTFGSIELKEKAWVTMGSTVGPGVTVGAGTTVMPGTVLLESVGPKRLVSGNPVKLMNIPFFPSSKNKTLEELAAAIQEQYCIWATTFDGSGAVFSNGALTITHWGRRITVSLGENADVALLTRPGETRKGMYFNLADLRTDERRHAAKSKFEGFMRLYYGLTFLSASKDLK